jgi:hypothetical protein
MGSSSSSHIQPDIRNSAPKIAGLAFRRHRGNRRSSRGCGLPDS